MALIPIPLEAVVKARGSTGSPRTENEPVRPELVEGQSSKMRHQPGELVLLPTHRFLQTTLSGHFWCLNQMENTQLLLSTLSVGTQEQWSPYAQNMRHMH